MERQHNRQARRRMIGWLGGAAGGIGIVALAVTILMPWGQSGEVVTTTRAHNRIFADEAGYIATINEYLAPGLVELDTVADQPATYAVAPQPATPADCRIVLGTALTLCAPDLETPREHHVTRQLNGPR